MKRNLIGTVSLVALSLLITNHGAYAQTACAGRCALRFQRRNHASACRPYKIKRADFDNNFIMISNVDTGDTVLSLFQRETPSHVNHKLIFHHRGNQYFLAEIWGGDRNAGMAMPATKARAAGRGRCAPATQTSRSRSDNRCIACTRSKFSSGSTVKGAPKEDVMKRNLFATLSLGALSVLFTATGAYAQPGLEATVPFAFNVGTTNCRPALYRITVDPLSSSVTIQNCKTVPRSSPMPSASTLAKRTTNWCSGRPTIDTSWPRSGESRAARA